jgi:hypothetical protein
LVVFESFTKGKKEMSDSELDKNRFVADLERSIASKKSRQRTHRIFQIVLTTVIGACGFLTAAASQAEGKDSGWSSPSLLLSIGLISTICAILNQVITPGEKSAYHRNCKKAFQYIKDEVQYGGMPVKEATKLRAAASDPQGLIGKLIDAVKR